MAHGPTTRTPRPRRRAGPGRGARRAARAVVLPVRRRRRVGAEPGGAGLLLDPGDRRRLAARPLDRRLARRGGRERHRRAAGDFHPAVGRGTDRHLGARRHADRHGLLRASAAQPRLLLPDRLPDLPRHRRLDRQLLDRRRHPRDRADGRGARDGARPGDHRRRGDLRRLFRRQAVAALRHRQPRLRRRRVGPLRALRRVAADLRALASRGARAVLEPRHAGGVRPGGRNREHRGRLPAVARCTSSRWPSCSRWRSCAGRPSSPSSSARSPAACSPSSTRRSG